MEDLPFLITILVSVIIGLYLGNLMSKYTHGKNKEEWKPFFIPDDAPESVKKSAKKQWFITLTVNLSVASIFVILFRILSGRKFLDFVMFGSASVIINMIFILIIALSRRDDFVKPLGGYSIAIGYILTLIIPFFSYYVFLSIAFSGFKIPFDF